MAFLLKKNFMTQQFIPYDRALEVKELGFVEPCLYGYDTFGALISSSAKWENWNQSLQLVSAPLWQQIFDWFREEHGIHYEIIFNKGRELPYTYVVNSVSSYLRSPFNKTYEDAKLECLKKLIEIFKNETIH